MRTLFFAAALSTMAFQALAQAPTAILYASPADVVAAESKARAAPQRIVAVPPYRVLVEYRKKPTPAVIHEKNNELFNLINGSGTIVVGGKLKDGKRSDAANMAGSGIDGGQSYSVAKGSYLFIPAGTAHYFAAIGPKGLTVTTIYIPASQ